MDEARHASEWKELSLGLVDRGLLFRDLPLTREALPAPAEEDVPIGEKSLDDLQAEMDALRNPVSVAFEGETGRRRLLAREIALKQREQSDGLTKAAEQPSGDVINSLDARDVAHLSRPN